MTTTMTARRAGGGKKARDRQRLAHLVAGVALIAYVYLPGDPLEAAVRWVVLPLLLASGALMWQWPKVRRWVRRRRSRA